jgi:hypothetical protein
MAIGVFKTFFKQHTLNTQGQRRITFNILAIRWDRIRKMSTGKTPEPTLTTQRMVMAI